MLLPDIVCQFPSRTYTEAVILPIPLVSFSISHRRTMNPARPRERPLHCKNCCIFERSFEGIYRSEGAETRGRSIELVQTWSNLVKHFQNPPISRRGRRGTRSTLEKGGKMEFKPCQTISNIFKTLPLLAFRGNG